MLLNWEGTSHILAAVPLSLEAHVNNLIVRFADYVRAFGASPAFKHSQLEAHLHTVELRSRLGSASAAAKDPEFAHSLWRTLTLWGMNKRRAELTPESVFRNSLRQCASEIGMLEDARLDAETLSATKAGDSIWGLIDRLRISATSARLVATTKALHHLLPHLVVPMDRQFTGAFFNWNNQAWQVKQEQSFKAAFLIFARIARSAKPAQYVSSGWNTSPTKVIDNAIVAYCQQNGLDKTIHKKAYEKAILAQAKERGIYD